MEINYAIEMAKRLVVDSIWKSARLEGLGTTFPKTEMILENLPVETSREEMLFIINMKRAWDFLLQNINYPVSLAFLRELNKIIGDNLFYGNGEIRKLPVRIGGTDWESKTPDVAELYDSIEKLELVEDVVDKSLRYFCFVARSQMFIDGNKRVAQLIVNKVLIEKGIGIFQIPVNAVNDFKSLLLGFYSSGNDSEIISFMKDYCVVRCDGKNKKYESSSKLVYDSTVDEINTIFSMSQGQVSLLDNILRNIRNLLSNLGCTGAWVLYEEDGKVYLNGKMGILMMKLYDYSIEKTGVFSKVSDELLREFLIKTIRLIVDKIPFSVKCIEFSMDVYMLSSGKFRNSTKEGGSIDFILR